MNAPDEVVFKIAGVNDIPDLTEIRIKFALDLKPLPPGDSLDELRSSVEEYLENHFTAGKYMGFLGYYGKVPVCSASLLLYDLPPLTDRPKRTVGHVLNVYTLPEYRRKGLASEIMKFLITEAEKAGINSLFLNATKMGEALYRKLGFKKQADAALILDLQ